jgi:putative oxidoreductase
MNSLSRFADPVYCLMRLIAGLMFACHGLDKIFGTFGGKIAAAPLMQAGGWIEIVCGFLIAFGILTRVAALIASGEMAAAFFMFHAKDGNLVPMVNHGELAVVYCWLFLFIFLYGPGRLSLDSVFCKHSAATTAPAT